MTIGIRPLQFFVLLVVLQLCLINNQCVSGVFVSEDSRSGNNVSHASYSQHITDEGQQPVIVSWSPSWKATDLKINYDVNIEPLCNSESSIGDFPDDLFTQEQRLQGAIVMHMFGAFYFFTLLAIVCNDYFLPTIECICEDLKISPDVAAATFMAVSGAIPEFFTNMISTFITESDMGLGAVIGTLFFNTLGVAACAGIATIKPVQLLWYPLARDCFIFAINVSLLTVMSWDGLIQWYEGLILSIGYIVYWIVLFQNTRMKRGVDHLTEKCGCCNPKSYDVEGDTNSPKPQEQTKDGESQVEPRFNNLEGTSNFPLRRMSIRLEFNAIQVERTRKFSVTSNPNATTPTPDVAEPQVEELAKVTLVNLWKIPKTSILGMVWFFYTWPIRALCALLIPNPKTRRRWYPLSFIMCIVFIGVNSYLIFWMIVVIGYTFGIPEVVMGLTILCWGSCLPEAIACIIIIRTGSGGVGVSNSLGSNSMAILFSLGVPWLLRTLVDGAWNADSAVNIYSHGINYIIMSILFAILSLFLILSAFRYRLKKTIGLVLLLAYGVFLTLSLLLELEVIFPSGVVC